MDECLQPVRFAAGKVFSILTRQLSVDPFEFAIELVHRSQIESGVLSSTTQHVKEVSSGTAGGCQSIFCGARAFYVECVVALVTGSR
jgi:hypothetical protein